MAKKTYRCEFKRKIVRAIIVFITGSSDVDNLPVEEQVDHFPSILKTASPQEVVDRVAAAAFLVVA
jgi:hypothetical protein